MQCCVYESRLRLFGNQACSVVGVMVQCMSHHMRVRMSVQPRIPGVVCNQGPEYIGGHLQGRPTAPNAHVTPNTESRKRETVPKHTPVGPPASSSRSFTIPLVRGRTPHEALPTFSLHRFGRVREGHKPPARPMSVIANCAQPGNSLLEGPDLAPQGRAARPGGAGAGGGSSEIFVAGPACRAPMSPLQHPLAVPCASARTTHAGACVLFRRAALWARRGR